MAVTFTALLLSYCYLVIFTTIFFNGCIKGCCVEKSMLTNDQTTKICRCNVKNWSNVNKLQASSVQYEVQYSRIVMKWL